MDEKIRFERKIIDFGNSKGLTIPTEVMNYLGNPESVYIMPDKSKHGVFIAIYSTKQKGE